MGWTQIFDTIDAFLLNLPLPMIDCFWLLRRLRVIRGYPTTQFGLIEEYTSWKPNWILGAIQESHVQQRFHRIAPRKAD
ncbi:TPA: hypothetical protein R1937_000470 [Staphylococcus delphini]|nr:hypothetical protein [Staphylococcus delphini]